MNGILLSQDNVFVSSQVFEISTIGNYESLIIDLLAGFVADI